MENVELLLKWLLFVAVLLPLVSFFLILCAYPKLGTSLGSGAVISVGAIGGACILSFICLGIWLNHHPLHPHEADPKGDAAAIRIDRDDPSAGPDIRLVSLLQDDHGHEHKQETKHEHEGEGHAEGSAAEHHEAVKPYTGEYYVLGQFGRLRLSISYYIDALTICMFCMVTLIATCIHVYAVGYMHEELHDMTDHEVTMADGSHLKRPGRFFRFFQYLSLFSFSMLGLVLAGNIAMVFVFWELVGICSYFLIGFYVERKTASTAANKAFIVNRVGDFGMIIGLMAIWSGMGTFAFGDIDYNSDGHIRDTAAAVEVGMFSQVRPAGLHHSLEVPDGMLIAGVSEDFRDEVGMVYADHAGLDENAPREAIEPSRLNAESEIASRLRDNDKNNWGRFLLIIAGIGIFCGCVGKSAQFPLHVWLPDAMEGPTPVSALVHSATMVAAGVYLVGRFYPVFTPEVLLVIAVVGMITLFMAATIAITATDIKRVLAYSTISQLGYMMMALGVGGWLAGMTHLITHAFFKSLLFLCSGSVIHAVHTNEMPQMGGLLKKMPVTAITMLIGCLAIAGVSIPFVVGLSGYYSKDAILEQAWSFAGAHNPAWAWMFFFAGAGGAAITAFYMFRMWFMTFMGTPRDEHRYDHAHESPPVMYVPLIILATFAVGVAWNPGEHWFEGIVGGILVTVIFVLIGLRYRASAEGSSERGAATRQLINVAIGIGVVMTLLSVIWMAEPASNVVLTNLLKSARPAGTGHGFHEAFGGVMTWPSEHDIHTEAAFWPIKVPVTLLAFGTGIAGILLAGAIYWKGILSPRDISNQFKAAHRFLLNKWWIDELYDFCFVQPVHIVSRVISEIDKRVIDRLIDGLAAVVRRISSVWEYVADQTIVDGAVNLFASWMYSLGVALRGVQRGRLREYVMFIVMGTIAIFALFLLFSRSLI